MYELTIKGFKTVDDVERFLKEIEAVKNNHDIKTDIAETHIEFQYAHLYDLVKYKIKNENPDGASVFCLDKDADPSAKIIHFSSLELLEKYFVVNGVIVTPKNIVEKNESTIIFTVGEDEYEFDISNLYMYAPKSAV